MNPAAQPVSFNRRCMIDRPAAPEMHQVCMAWTACACSVCEGEGESSTSRGRGRGRGRGRAQAPARARTSARTGEGEHEEDEHEHEEEHEHEDSTSTSTSVSMSTSTSTSTSMTTCRTPKVSRKSATCRHVSPAKGPGQLTVGRDEHEDSRARTRAGRTAAQASQPAATTQSADSAAFESNTVNTPSSWP